LKRKGQKESQDLSIGGGIRRASRKSEEPMMRFERGKTGKEDNSSKDISRKIAGKGSSTKGNERTSGQHDMGS